MKYYPIDEAAARRAREMNSFFTYQDGSATEAYRREVDAAVEIAERQKLRVDPIHHEKIESLLDTYARKLAENINKRNAIAARVPSVLIAGPANFPVRKKEKQNQADATAMEEWRQIQGLLDKIRSTGRGGISADDPEAVEKLRAKLDSLERTQDHMKAVNAYFRKNNTLDGCPGLSAEETERLKVNMARDWHVPSKPFPSYMLTNNNSMIRQAKNRIAELTRQAETGYEGWLFDGGRVAFNREINRLQVFFEEKPDEDTRAVLKNSGFRWAPSMGAWQRQLNDHAIRAAKDLDCLRPLPEELPSSSVRQKPPHRRSQER